MVFHPKRNGTSANFDSTRSEILDVTSFFPQPFGSSPQKTTEKSKKPLWDVRKCGLNHFGGLSLPKKKEALARQGLSGYPASFCPPAREPRPAARRRGSRAPPRAASWGSLGRPEMSAAGEWGGTAFVSSSFLVGGGGRFWGGVFFVFVCFLVGGGYVFCWEGGQGDDGFLRVVVFFLGGGV